MTKRIAIIGCERYLLDDIPWDDKHCEFWGINNCHQLFKRERKWDAWFQIHTWNRCAALPYHKEWLEQEHDFPIYMQKEYEWVPSSVKYPIGKVMFYVSEYLTNTISMMLALIIYRIQQGEYKDLQQVRLYGVAFESYQEFMNERASCEYFLGMLEGMGIDVWMPDKCPLLKSHIIYGYEDKTDWRLE